MGGGDNNDGTVDLSKYAKLVDEPSIATHPIYEFLPDTFKKQVIDMESQNKTMRFDLSSVNVAPSQLADIPTSLVDPKALFAGGADSTRTEDQMLNYVRG